MRHDVCLLFYILPLRNPCFERLVVFLLPSSKLRSSYTAKMQPGMTYLSQADWRALGNNVADRRGSLAHLRFNVLGFIPFCDHLRVNLFLLRDKFVRIFFRLRSGINMMGSRNRQIEADGALFSWPLSPSARYLPTLRDCSPRSRLSHDISDISTRQATIESYALPSRHTSE